MFSGMESQISVCLVCLAWIQYRLRSITVPPSYEIQVMVDVSNFYGCQVPLNAGID